MIDRIVSKSTHEWPRMTTSDHKWEYKKIFFWRHSHVIIIYLPLFKRK